MVRTKTGIGISLIVAISCVFCVSSSFAYSRDEDKWTGEDKALHLGVSCALDVCSYNFYKKNTDYTDGQARLAAFFTTLAIGVAKEFIDDRFSWKDIGADVLGAGIGGAISIEF